MNMHAASIEPSPDIIPPHDHSDYYEKLASSLPEKLFFLKMLPKDITTVADFGCGDGALLRECQKAGYKTIGYDHSSEAIKLACGWDKTHLWTPRLETFKAHIERAKKQGEKVCLVLSSVIHEVLSEPGVTWSLFWRTICELDADCIAIRDMAVDKECHAITTDRNPLLAFAPKAATFADTLQYLLKYRYADDMLKEQAENYFPLSIQQLHLKLNQFPYELAHLRHYLPNWWHERWRQDFGLVITEPTHYQAFLMRRA